MKSIAYGKKRLAELEEEGVPVIMADESCLTVKTIQTHEWMVKRKNICIDEKQLNSACCAFVVALSKEHGFVHYRHFKKSID